MRHPRTSKFNIVPMSKRNTLNWVPLCDESKVGLSMNKIPARCAFLAGYILRDWQKRRHKNVVFTGGIAILVNWWILTQYLEKNKELFSSKYLAKMFQYTRIANTHLNVSFLTHHFSWCRVFQADNNGRFSRNCFVRSTIWILWFRPNSCLLFSPKWSWSFRGTPFFKVKLKFWSNSCLLFSQK